MNYGYNNTTNGWAESRKLILAQELSKVLNIPIQNEIGYKNDGKSPYIEVDGSYEGVRIRRITYLSEEEHDKLVEEADRIYWLVMNNLIRE